MAKVNANLEASSYFSVPESLIKRTDDNQTELPDYRTQFMRDRDRVMYATAFRRLAGKTQIYTVGAVDDHRKTRLTHTLEVAEIARTIAHALKLDENLAEAIALGHDLGHTPFGHAGEEMLHMIMKPQSKYVKDSPFYKKSKDDIEGALIEQGYSKEYQEIAYGFKHNIQSVRVAAKLEDAYRNKDNRNIGLNLTNYTLYGMMIHSKMKYAKHELRNEPVFWREFEELMKLKDSKTYAWSFEAFIVEWADDIAQWHHDLEDALLDGIMPLKVICNTVIGALGELAEKQGKGNRIEELKKIIETSGKSRYVVAKLSNLVVDTLVTDLVQTARENFNRLKSSLSQKYNLDIENDANLVKLFKNYQDYAEGNPDSPKSAFGWVIDVSDKAIKTTFKETIGEWIHHSRNVQRMNVKGQYIIRKLFAAYVSNPQQLTEGPILHLLIDTNELYYAHASHKANAGQEDTYSTIDKAIDAGIGAARVELDKRLEANDIYFQMMLMRRICDHISSMTDRYAKEEYEKLYG